MSNDNHEILTKYSEKVMDIITDFVDDMFDIVSQGEYDQAPYGQYNDFRTERRCIYDTIISWLDVTNNSIGKKKFYKYLSNKYTCIARGHKHFYLLKLKKSK